MADNTDSTICLLTKYADTKSKVNITGEESRVELMEKVLEMDEEISTLLKALRKKNDEVRLLTSKMSDMKDESARTEMGLVEELGIMNNKNNVMSELLEIITDRAEAAEEELVRRFSVVIDDGEASGTEDGNTEDVPPSD